MKAEFDGDPSDIDTTGMTGVSILFPNLEDEWAKDRMEWVKNLWVELMDDTMMNRKMNWPIFQ